jgi:hypothetical protein
MRISLISAVACAALLSMASFNAQALPGAAQTTVSGPDVTLVAGGCGPGWHRGPRLGCVRDRDVIVVPGAPLVVETPRVVVEPPVVVAPRGCPIGTHWSRYRQHCVLN